MQRTFLNSVGQAAMKRVFQKGKAMQEESMAEEICNLSELDCKVLDSVKLWQSLTWCLNAVESEEAFDA